MLRYHSKYTSVCRAALRTILGLYTGLAIEAHSQTLIKEQSAQHRSAIQTDSITPSSTPALQAWAPKVFDSVEITHSKIFPLKLHLEHSLDSKIHLNFSLPQGNGLPCRKKRYDLVISTGNKAAQSCIKMGYQSIATTQHKLVIYLGNDNKEEELKIAVVANTAQSEAAEYQFDSIHIVKVRSAEEQLSAFVSGKVNAIIAPHGYATHLAGLIRKKIHTFRPMQQTAKIHYLVPISMPYETKKKLENALGKPSIAQTETMKLLGINQFYHSLPYNHKMTSVTKDN